MNDASGYAAPSRSFGEARSTLQLQHPVAIGTAEQSSERTRV